MRHELDFKIAGFGAALPARKLENPQLAAELGVAPEWIEQRCGVRSRFVAEAETTSALGVAAARQALAMAPDKRPGLVICSTCTPDYRICPSAPSIAHALGLNGAGAFDLNGACAGGVIGLLTALTFLAVDGDSPILLVCSDTVSRFLDGGDCQTRIMIGDGAAALLLERGAGGGARLRSWTVGADGAGADYFLVPGGGSAAPRPTAGLQGAAWETAQMNGRAMFRFAVEKGAQVLRELCQQGNVTFEEIDWVLVHQANARIIRSLQERTGIPPQRWLSNIGAVGNTAGASIPLCLVEALSRGIPKPGDRVLVAGFGSGLTWAGLLAEW